ncbi:NAD(P)-dependent oxidoreductase [Actinoplanes sp. TFC3]|uniref:NAD-dependent epimerase/dehydratase family protein n=1 Tax=Actinoplanes sp. TFC3 TaxID=1710355 RepID=UPI000831AC03|nr:NAD-dependent epimerase/dehydratase family protein [Actinoplanes sp. TFC3]
MTFSRHRRVTVLGGTGFAGRHIAGAFAAAGWQVTVAARRPHPTTVFPYAPITLDAAPGTLAAALQRTEPDVVVNAAGAYWGLTGAALHDALAGSTERLLAAWPLLGSPARLIHLGSVMEYAAVSGRTLLDESSPVDAATPYGAAKLHATRAVERAAGVDAVVLRVTNSVGPGVDPASLLGKVAQALGTARREGSTARIVLAPLHARRDYLDVRDLGEAVVAAAVHGRPGQLINIGSGTAIGVRELVDRLITASGIPAQVDERSDAPSSPGAVADWLAVNPWTAARLLGWRARRSIERAVADLWDAEIEADHSIADRLRVDAGRAQSALTLRR